LPRAQLAAQRRAEAAHRGLGGAVGADERRADAPADRADVHDPPAADAQRLEQRLGDGDQAEDVDLVLAADPVERDALEGPGDGDAGVVDEPGERAAADALRERGDLVRIGDVDDDRLDARIGGVQGGAVLLAAYAGEHGEAAGGEAQRGDLADAGRGAG